MRIVVVCIHFLFLRSLLPTASISTWRIFACCRTIPTSRLWTFGKFSAIRAVEKCRLTVVALGCLTRHTDVEKMPILFLHKARQRLLLFAPGHSLGLHFLVVAKQDGRSCTRACWKQSRLWRVVQSLVCSMHPPARSAYHSVVVLH